MASFSFSRFFSMDILGFILVIIACIALFILAKRKFSLGKPFTISFGILLVGLFLFVFLPQFGPYSSFPFYIKTFGPADGPDIPIKNIPTFLKSRFDYVSDIARDPNDLPPPLTRTINETVHVDLETQEVIAEIAPGIKYNYWTFNGKVPGPFVRVLEGDTVEVSIKNNQTSIHPHNIDFHAVTGPGGGATVTNVNPGETKMFIFKALNPGLYVYHCAHPNVSTHMAHGMYGLILVEPKGGLPKVDKEFYIMQGELYTQGALGKKACRYLMQARCSLEIRSISFGMDALAEQQEP